MDQLRTKKPNKQKHLYPPPPNTHTLFCRLKFAGELLIPLLGCSRRALGELFIVYIILFLPMVGDNKQLSSASFEMSDGEQSLSLASKGKA